MNNTATETGSTIGKLYDKAYWQGFTHAVELVKAFNGRVSSDTIIEQLEKYIAEKQPETIAS